MFYPWERTDVTRSFIVTRGAGYRAAVQPEMKTVSAKPIPPFESTAVKPLVQGPLRLLKTQYSDSCQATMALAARMCPTTSGVRRPCAPSSRARPTGRPFWDDPSASKGMDRWSSARVAMARQQSDLSIACVRFYCFEIVAGGVSFASVGVVAVPGH